MTFFLWARTSGTDAVSLLSFLPAQQPSRVIGPTTNFAVAGKSDYYVPFIFKVCHFAVIVTKGDFFLGGKHFYLECDIIGDRWKKPGT